MHFCMAPFFLQNLFLASNWFCRVGPSVFSDEEKTFMGFIANSPGTLKTFLPAVLRNYAVFQQVNCCNLCVAVENNLIL